MAVDAIAKTTVAVHAVIQIAEVVVVVRAVTVVTRAAVATVVIMEVIHPQDAPLVEALIRAER